MHAAFCGSSLPGVVVAGGSNVSQAIPHNIEGPVLIAGSGPSLSMLLERYRSWESSLRSFST